MNPEYAYLEAKKNGGTNRLLKYAKNSFEYAYKYARFITGDLKILRIKACKSPKYAYMYARFIQASNYTKKKHVNPLSSPCFMP